MHGNQGPCTRNLPFGAGMFSKGLSNHIKAFCRASQYLWPIGWDKRQFLKQWVEVDLVKQWTRFTLYKWIIEHPLMHVTMWQYTLWYRKFLWFLLASLKKIFAGECAGIQQRDVLDQNIVNPQMINCRIVENGCSTYPETKGDILDATVCRWVAAPRREKGCWGVNWWRKKLSHAML